jgi:small subunit ribosomal protein S6
MRRYETIIITDPDLSAEERDPVLQRVADVINQGDGYLAFTDEWGARKLAYEIKKKDRGYYIRFDFCGTGAMVNEIERFFRIDDRVLKYMTVLLDKAADIEKIKEEIAATQSDAEKAKEQAQIAAEQVSSEEPAEVQAETVAAPVSSEEPAEVQAETAAAPVSSEEPAEAQTDSKETPTPEPEIGESEDTLVETEEEKK